MCWFFLSAGLNWSIFLHISVQCNLGKQEFTVTSIVIMVEVHEVNAVFQPLNYWSIMLLRMFGAKLHTAGSKVSPVVCVCLCVWGFGGGGFGCVYLYHGYSYKLECSAQCSRESSLVHCRAYCSGNLPTTRVVLRSCETSQRVRKKIKEGESLGPFCM